MSRTYNNIYDTNANDKAVNKNGEQTSFVYGDLQQRVQVVNAKAINSSTAFVSVNENNAIMVDVKRVPNKFTVFDENSGETVQFDGSTSIQIKLPENITEIEYKTSPNDNIPAPGFVKGEHYLDFTYGLGVFARHKYVSLKPMQDLIKAEEIRAINAEELLQNNIEHETARAEGAESRLRSDLGDEVTRATTTEGGLRTDVNAINSKIPNQASSENQLADKAFVNSSIQNMAAFYVTYDAQGNPFPTKQALVNSTQVYIDGQARASIGHNDYCIVVADESKHELSGDPTTRYIYQGTLDEPYDASKWAFQYVINNSGLTAEQLAAINSGITENLVTKFNGYETNKQDTLVSGTNIKTINSQSILGSGDLVIEGVTNYDDLRTGKPIINADLGSAEFSPVENTYYRHTGASSEGKASLHQDDAVDGLYFNATLTTEQTKAILEDFVDQDYPMLSGDTETGGFWLAFSITKDVDEVTRNYLFYYIPAGEGSPAIDKTKDSYIIIAMDGFSSAFTIVYTNEDINLDGTTVSAGWSVSSEEIVGVVAEVNYADYVNQLAWAKGESYQTGLIYLYRNSEFTLNDYNLSSNRPIFNADVVVEETSEGEYYKQKENKVYVSKPFENGKYYYRIGFTKEADPVEFVSRLDNLYATVTPDYVGMTKGTGSTAKSVRYDKIDEYIADGYSLDGSKYWVLISILKREDFPVIGSNLNPLLMLMADGDTYVITWFSLFPVWANVDIDLFSAHIKAFEWLTLFTGYENYLPVASLSGGASIALYPMHTEVWSDLIGAEVSSIEKGTIGRVVDSKFNPLLYKETAELPPITSIGKVLQSSGDAEFDFYFKKDDSDGKYKYYNGPDELKLFVNVELSIPDVSSILEDLFTALGDDDWHIQVEFGSHWASNDVTDIYFHRDATISDPEVSCGYVIAEKFRDNNDLTPIFSNYATTYTIDTYSVTITETGWLPRENNIAYDLIFDEDCEYLYYELPDVEAPANLYGQIITSTYVIDDDYSFEHHVVFYGEVANPRAEWVDIEIPEGGGLPDYSEASNNDVLKVNVTPAVVAFVPSMEADQVIDGVYVLHDDMPTSFGDLSKNDHVDDIESTRAIRVIVNGTKEGTPDTSLYVSLHLIQYNSVQYVLLCSQPTLSDNLDMLGMLYVYYPPYQEGWSTQAVTDLGDFYEVLNKALSDIGFTDYTLTVESVFAQDEWKSWMGCSTNVQEIVPSTRSVEWGSPLPEIKKSGQVLTSSCEAYSFEFAKNSSSDYRCPVESSGKLYFNTDLGVDDVVSVVDTLARASGSSTPQFTLQVKSSSDQMLTPRISFIIGDNSTYAIVAVIQTSIYQLWANFDGELVIESRQTGLICSIGWNSSNLENYTSWTGASYIQYTSPNTVIPTSIYGRLMSLQDGLFYGDVRNAKAVWEDLDISSELSEVNVDYSNITSYNTSSTTPYRLFGQEGSTGTKVVSWGPDSVKGWLGIKSNINSSFTVYSYDWTSSNDEYYTTVYIQDLTNNDTLIVVPSSQSNAKSAQEANIYYGYSSGTTLYMYCTNQPTTDITFNYTIIR